MTPEQVAQMMARLAALEAAIKALVDAAKRPRDVKMFGRKVGTIE